MDHVIGIGTLPKMRGHLGIVEGHGPVHAQDPVRQTYAGDAQGRSQIRQRRRPLVGAGRHDGHLVAALQQAEHLMESGRADPWRTDREWKTVENSHRSPEPKRTSKS